jgi:hypothetical protein
MRFDDLKKGEFYKIIADVDYHNTSLSFPGIKGPSKDIHKLSQKFPTWGAFVGTNVKVIDFELDYKSEGNHCAWVIVPDIPAVSIVIHPSYLEIADDACRCSIQKLWLKGCNCGAFRNEKKSSKLFQTS